MFLVFILLFSYKYLFSPKFEQHFLCVVNICCKFGFFSPHNHSQTAYSQYVCVVFSVRPQHGERHHSGGDKLH